LDVPMDTWNFLYTWLVSLWLHRIYIYSVTAFGISLWIAVQFFTTKAKRKVTELKYIPLRRAEELFETTSEEEADAEEAGGTDSVVDVEDLGKIMSHMKKAKVLLLQQLQNCSAITSEGCQKDPADNLLLLLILLSCARGRRVPDGFVHTAAFTLVSFSSRHHTNPVGTEWRWKMDQPEMILREALENHRNMIKEFKGNFSSHPRRFLKVQNGAIQKTVISFSFLLPRNLEPVTQLYVSVDASTKESLKRIDRPLFKDFWQRFLDSLKALSEKDLGAGVSAADCPLVSPQGVTYCGDSSASSLTMANVPWHEEVVHFVQELAQLLPDYGIACEHEHSNCLLIAHKKVILTKSRWIDGC
uniref:tRNA wybutosine-synthesis domain-containing protein n=1 Tax=Pavo cristatus TaxID=9049 RepID=A0A8C9FRB2_PAVCR